ncbi:hypothetical protein CYMTET_56836 [Cymbomonas tetramitiformis]|uniref:Uncharacterized protein n=1 Tax=Cymbomonas tetramitiformis TaxID=36881 RepID=A0AAE0BBW4_9CHLO|nr:hypothetical protein CYMTET_56836 [Cymbomonas tetramitiformis]
MAATFRSSLFDVDDSKTIIQPIESRLFQFDSAQSPRPSANAAREEFCNSIASLGGNTSLNGSATHGSNATANGSATRGNQANANLDESLNAAFHAGPAEAPRPHTSGGTVGNRETLSPLTVGEILVRNDAFRFSKAVANPQKGAPMFPADGGSVTGSPFLMATTSDRAPGQLGQPAFPTAFPFNNYIPPTSPVTMVAAHAAPS